jgi:hypothetical protein
MGLCAALGWYTKKQLSQFPMKPINPESVQLVDTIIILNERLRSFRTDQEWIALQCQIDATGHQIDQLVFQLYGLSDK